MQTQHYNIGYMEPIDLPVRVDVLYKPVTPQY